jgi:hypothetical protein
MCACIRCCDYRVGLSEVIPVQFMSNWLMVSLSDIFSRGYCEPTPPKRLRAFHDTRHRLPRPHPRLTRSGTHGPTPTQI